MYRRVDEQILGISTLWLLIPAFHAISACNMYLVGFSIYSLFVLFVSLMFWKDMDANTNTYLHVLDTTMARGYVVILYLLDPVREIDLTVKYLLIVGIAMFYNLSCVLYNNNYLIDSMYSHLLFRMFGYILYHLTVIRQEKNMTLVFPFFTLLYFFHVFMLKLIKDDYFEKVVLSLLYIVAVGYIHSNYLL